ncbi:helix-turn-helix domain-containing protein [Megasphaera elsdenii]|uniref:helix-turn-helix domain-containing protein n=1 Tax=Megasphaera elsdenii TaxID=907 RepID=UPI00242E7A86|nr:helix-turn-helix transcriptional regulator [Megasphaera elsdenii]
MKSLGERLRYLRERSGKTQKDMADLLHINRVSYTQYENNKRTPPPDTLKKIAEIFTVSVDYLLGTLDVSDSSSLPPLTAKDERDIARDLENMIESLDGSAAMGDIEDDEDFELLRSSLETAMKIAKRTAKKKFTPKKYRK